MTLPTWQTLFGLWHNWMLRKAVLKVWMLRIMISRSIREGGCIQTRARFDSKGVDRNTDEMDGTQDSATLPHASSFLL